MKIEIDIDPYELVKYIKSTASISLILKELDSDEADILDYMPIEKLIQFAYDKDPDQVKESLLNILGITEESITPTPNENIFLNGKFYICKEIIEKRM